MKTKKLDNPNRGNIHIHLETAERVRNITEKTGMPLSETVDRLCAYALEHAVLVPSTVYTLAFDALPGKAADSHG